METHTFFVSLSLHFMSPTRFVLVGERGDGGGCDGLGGGDGGGGLGGDEGGGVGLKGGDEDGGDGLGKGGNEVGDGLEVDRWLVDVDAEWTRNPGKV